MGNKRNLFIWMFTIVVGLILVTVTIDGVINKISGDDLSAYIALLSAYIAIVTAFMTANANENSKSESSKEIKEINKKITKIIELLEKEK